MPTGNPESPIIHSDVFFLVDGEGFVRRVYDSMDTYAMDALASDARPGKYFDRNGSSDARIARFAKSTGTSLGAVSATLSRASHAERWLLARMRNEVFRGACLS